MTTTPTLSDLFSAVSADFKNRFNITSENDLKRVLTALAASNAGFLKLLYLAISDVKKNIWPDKADPESMGGTLERFGRIKLNRDPYPAIVGEYTISVYGSKGVVIPEGTQFKSADDSTHPNCLFTSTESITLVGNSNIDIVHIIANNAGTDYSLSVNDSLNTVNPITNLSSVVSVSAVVTAPSDAEDIEIYRELVLEAFRLEPNGGSPSDFVYWALDVKGIRTVYPYTTKGAAGMATIYAEATVEASSDGYGTTPQALLDALWKSDKTGVFELDPDVTQTIYNRGRRPLGLTDLTILSVTPLQVIVTITNLKDQSDDVKNSISAEVTKTLYYKRPYVPGVGDINDRNDKLYLSDIISSIQNAIETGNTYDSVSVTVNGLGLPFQFIDGNIPYLKSIIYA